MRVSGQGIIPVLTLWRRETLRHAADKPADVFFPENGHPDPNMTAARPWAAQVLGNLIQVDIAVIDFQQQLQGALQPRMQALHAG